ncbi:ABC transporter ATP-binding protein [Nonomuraea sp. K274]|uniref:ABC transporter ATP-binding protein n=1 Tax=Nonomuraea cypriaca TaxID=1187855 RepID=A0A931EY41_9ACTN|nr:ABC transporter ATP-binding protein [Nonomuraea cypriaca]MBF8186920.1 ABC transporter ATP-binding protein [Nonomuraea cypriaca]
MRTALECEGLTKRYGGLLAVDGLKLCVAQGEAYGLLGPNGSGKSTTIGMIVGVLAPDSGIARVHGHDVWRQPRQAKGLVGYVPQEVALYPDLTGRENLRYFGRLFGLRGRRLAERVSALLDVVGLADRADQLLGTYSGGMQRRINIAAGLVHEPSVLILDEPTVGVDPQSRNAILESVQRLVADGMTVLYTSHYMEEVEKVCDRVGVIDHGRILAEGTPEELMGMLAPGGRTEIEVEGDVRAAEAAVAALAGVTVTAHRSRLLIAWGEGADRLADVLRALDGVVTVVRTEAVRPTLEEVFLQLTGTSLRD